MDTIRAAVEAVHLFLEDRGVPQNVRALPKRLVYDYLVMYHNSIREVFRQQERQTGVRTQQYTYLECIPICEVEIGECPEDGFEGCVWYRTEHPLPKFSGADINHVYLSISGGRTEIYYTDLKDWSDDKNSFRTWMKNMDRYTIRKLVDGTYAYFEFEKGKIPDKVSMAADWTDTMELLQYGKDPKHDVMEDFLGTRYEIDPLYTPQVIESTAGALRNMLGLFSVSDAKADNLDADKNPIQ